MANQERLRNAWNESAEGYDQYFVPRFRPWIEAAVNELVSIWPVNSSGSVLIPCCGTAPEVELLLRQIPDISKIVGLDLSEKMIELAQQRYPQKQVQFFVGDASAVSLSYKNVDALLSCFGLQQMPAPADVIVDWYKCLTLGGVLSVLWWPPSVGDDSVFDQARRVSTEFFGAQDASWDSAIAPQLLKAGAQLLSDKRLDFEMGHESAQNCLDAFLSSGPWRALSNKVGEEKIAEWRRRVLAELPEGPLRHRPYARLIIARKPLT